MKPKIEIVLLTLSVLLQGCATMTKSSVLGALVGGTVGAIITSQQSPEAAPVGAVVGASLGGLFGYLSFKEREKETKPSPLKNPDDEFPGLTQPKVRSIWVPDKIEGNQYIKGHRVFILEEGGTWKKE